MNIKLIQQIISNKSEHIAIKKAAIKYADAIGTPMAMFKSVASKQETETSVKKIQIVGNTNYWLDSHGDVHVAGNWNKTISDNGKKFHLHDHKFEIMAQVGKIDGLQEMQIEWSKLGVSKEGFTTSLVASSTISKEMNERIYKAYMSGDITQHSVGMQYVKIDFAVNPEAYKDEQSNANWNEVYPLLGNQEKADENGMFWVVRESKLIEISAVLMGSNSLTPTLENKQEPFDNTLANDAAANALRLNELYNNLKF